MGSGTGLSECKKSYCLSVPIAMSTLLEGWVTILLSENNWKGAFSYRDRSGWDQSLGKREGEREESQPVILAPFFYLFAFWPM